MATKKKAAKPAKKVSNVKKVAPAKKAAAKPVHSSGKAAKKAPAPKSPAKVPVAKKAAPVASKKSIPAPPAKKGFPSKSIPSKTMPSKPIPPPPASKTMPAAAAVKPIPVIPRTIVKQPPVPPSTPPAKQPVIPGNKGIIKEEPKKGVHSKPTKVVIPEIKTKTVRKYEPEFTKSVLDTHQEEQTGPTMRYSDSELGEFRDLINRKLDAAKKELAYLQGLITRKDEMGGDNDDARYMTMEDGSMSMEREQLSQMASRQITFIDHLEKAIMRIENKTYGICRVTGKLIDKARLRAVPHATLSIEAKQMMNK